MAKQTIDDIKEAASERFENIKLHASDALDTLEGKLGSRTRAIACVSAGGAVVVVAVAVALGGIPLTSGPAASADSAQTETGSDVADEVGNGISGSDRSEAATQSDKSSSALVPDEAKTVTELSKEKVVTAKVTGVVDSTHLTCQLVNGDTVTVRLLDVTSGSSPMLEAGGAVPYVLAKEGRSIWLERDNVTVEEDGTWPRYLWTADPTKRDADATVDLYQCYGCSPERNWFTYAPEDNANSYATAFEKVANEQTEKSDKDVEEEQREQWEARKQQQEAIEAAQGGEDGSTDTDQSDGEQSGPLMLPPEGSVLPDD